MRIDVHKNYISKIYCFTLLELLIVIGVISLLASLLLPALNSARKTAQSSICQSNLKQFGLAVFSYGNDYDYFPSGYDGSNVWWQKDSPISSYLSYDKIADAIFYKPDGATVLNCPGSKYKEYINPKQGDFYDYAANSQLFNKYDDSRTATRLSMVKNAAKTVMMFDRFREHTVNQDGYWGLVDFAHYVNGAYVDRIYARRHRGRFNLLWVDGHVDSRNPGSILWEEFGPPLP